MFKKILFLIITSILLTSCVNTASQEPGDTVDIPDRLDDFVDDDQLLTFVDSDGKPPIYVGNTPVTWSVCGTRPSYHPCNFNLLDQNGENFELYDHYGSAIVLDFSAMWCGPCRNAALSAQEHYDHYLKQDLLYITVLIENVNRDPMTLEDAQQWALQSEITTAPILLGSRDMLESSGGSWRLTGWPTFYLIDRDMEMYVSMRGWNEKYLLDYIEEIL